MKKQLLILSLMLGLANTTHAEPLTSTQLHAVLGVVTNLSRYTSPETVKEPKNHLDKTTKMV